MVDLNEYLGKLISECKAAFRDRLLYMGLQGSYLRGEATENSDIDIMIILDHFDLQDMDTYRSILKKIGSFEKSCGFICGREEMSRWNPLEVCQLLHTTKDLVGSLADFLPEASEKDEVNYVKLSLGNLYHEICHRYIHADRAKNVSRFRGTCKGLYFLIQNLRYLETGRFTVTKAELMELSDEEDRQVLKLSELPDGFDFNEALSTLFAWMQHAFARIDAVNDRVEEGSHSGGSTI